MLLLQRNHWQKRRCLNVSYAYKEGPRQTDQLCHPGIEKKAKAKTKHEEEIFVNRKWRKTKIKEI